MKRTIFTKCVLVLLALAAWGNCAGAVGQPGTDGDSASVPTWTSRPWTGDDVPFERQRLILLAADKKRALTGATLAHLKMEAQKSPNDALAQFCWGWAAVLFGELNHTDWQDRTLEPLDHGALDRPMAAVAGSPVPLPSFNYVRLRFLVRVDYNGYWIGWAPLAVKIVSYRNDDLFAARYAAFILAKSRYPGYRRQAMKLFVGANRKFGLIGSADYYGGLATLDFDECHATDFRSGFEETLKAIRAYLPLADPRDPWLPRAKTILRVLPLEKAQYAQKRDHVVP